MIQDIKTITLLEDVLEKQSSILIFKHSTICPISSSAYREFVNYSESNHNILFYRILVRENRDVSNLIAEKTSIRHQSPQVLLMINGEVIWHTSHYDITFDALDNNIQQNI